MKPKGPRASRLRQRKFEFLRRGRIPEDGLPGSLSESQTRCGKTSCRCARGEGHTAWSLTFRAGGRTYVQRVPSEWVDYVRRHVEEGRAFKDQINELFAINANLWLLSRRARTK